jgi:hypothetical protein
MTNDGLPPGRECADRIATTVFGVMTSVLAKPSSRLKEEWSDTGR